MLREEDVKDAEFWEEGKVKKNVWEVKVNVKAGKQNSEKVKQKEAREKKTIINLRKSRRNTVK